VDARPRVRDPQTHGREAGGESVSVSVKVQVAAVCEGWKVKGRKGLGFFSPYICTQLWVVG
jgi:hypothetical protein